ncbi:hypothetical protein INR49_026929 [Caranx melampygus]|nr:hypothetical protein INR49_026929 [Caranx melampygus]
MAPSATITTITTTTLITTITALASTTILQAMSHLELASMLLIPILFLRHSMHPLLSSFPGEFPARPQCPPQTSTAHSHGQGSPLGRNLMGSLWQEGGRQDSRLYEGSPLHSRGNYTGLDQQPLHQINWDPHYQQSPKPCYDPFTFQSHPEVHEKKRHPPWGRQAHSSPRGLSTSSLPPLPQHSLPSLTSHNNHLPPVPQHQEPPALGRYQELRERMFVNLCCIFPTDLLSHNALKSSSSSESVARVWGLRVVTSEIKTCALLGRRGRSSKKQVAV